MENLKWFLIDAEGKSPGRIAEEISKVLRGKNSVPFDPSRLAPNGVVVINAKKIKVTGRKTTQKEYFYHRTTKPGAWKKISLGKLLEEKPEEIIYNAVKGMLPKNRLRKKALSRMRIYPDEKHPHSANIVGRIDV